MTQFIGIIHKDKDSEYGISFPDFSGCVSAGATVEECMAMGQEALQGHIDCMLDFGDTLPDMPMTYEQARNHESMRDCVLVTLVSVQLPAKSKRINVNMDEHLLEAIAKVSSNRSAFLAEAARRYLQEMK